MKKKIALVTGGYSGESVISYKSATSIQKNIDTDKWECYLIDINPEGWYYLNDVNNKIPVDKNDFSITVQQQKINFDEFKAIIESKDCTKADFSMPSDGLFLNKVSFS